MKIISDERLLKVPIKDNGEKLVDIKKYCPKVIVRPGAYIKKEGEKYFFKAAFVREGVAKEFWLHKIYYQRVIKLFCVVAIGRYLCRKKDIFGCITS